MGAVKKTIIGIVIFLLLIGVFVYFQFFQESITPAILNIETGTAQVDLGNGWEDAYHGMKLSLNDKVKVTGTSVIVLYESILVELESNAEIAINSLDFERISIRQESGSTWTKFTKVLGIQSYEVETPTTVAVIRGTEFGLDYSKETGDSTVLVGEGKVQVDSDDESVDLNAFEKSLRTGEGLIKAELTDADKERILSQMKKNLERLKNLRKGLINKNEAIIGRAIQAYGEPGENLDSYLEKIDMGYIDDTELIEKSPVKIPAMERAKKLNDEIKKQLKLIEDIENS